MAKLLLVVFPLLGLLTHPSLSAPQALTYSHHVSRGLPTGTNLTILPVGDSITVGVQSTDGNGYRLDLMNMLKNDGQTVQMLGSQSSGTNNPDNLEEGFGWNNITQILDHLKADDILSQQPDLVLLHAGTNDNDAVNASDKDAATCLGDLIDYILFEDPKAIVLVAALIQNNYRPEETAEFNTLVPGVVADRLAKGFKVMMVDMSSVNELSDLLHPNDAGYDHMAQLWYSAILNIPSAWWSTSNKLSGLQSTITSGIVSTTTASGSYSTMSSTTIVTSPSITSSASSSMTATAGGLGTPTVSAAPVSSTTTGGSSKFDFSSLTIISWVIFVSSLLFWRT